MLLNICPECGVSNEPYDKVNVIAKCRNCKCYYIITEKENELNKSIGSELNKFIEKNFKEPTIIKFIKNLFNFTEKHNSYKPNIKYITINNTNLMRNPIKLIYQLLILYNIEKNLGFKYITLINREYIPYINKNLNENSIIKIEFGPSSTKNPKEIGHDLLEEIYLEARSKKINIIIISSSYFKSHFMSPDYIIDEDFSFSSNYFSIKNTHNSYNKIYEVK